MIPPFQVMSLIKLRHEQPAVKKERVILDRPVCQQGFRKLLGLGAGRYLKLTRAVAAGRDAPLDGRQRPRKDDGSNPGSVKKRALIVEFLEELVQTVAEAMPEASGKRKASLDGQPLEPSMKFRRLRGKRPGKWKRVATRQPPPSDPSNPEPEVPEVPMRMLPPGSFTDYYRMLEAKFPAEQFSLKLFCAVCGLKFDVSFFCVLSQLNVI